MEKTPIHQKTSLEIIMRKQIRDINTSHDIYPDHVPSAVVPSSSLKRCEASGLLTGSKLTYAFIIALSAVQGSTICCFLIHAASHEEAGPRVLPTVPDKACGFPLATFLGLKVLVTIFQ